MKSPCITSYIIALLLWNGRAQAFAPIIISPSDPHYRVTATSTTRITTTTSSPTTTTSLYLELLKPKTLDEKEVAELLETYSEKSRFYRRDYYSSADWLYQRRPRRFITRLLTTLECGLIRQLNEQLTFVTFNSLLIVLYNDLLVTGLEDLDGFHYFPLIDNMPLAQLPLAPFLLSSSALSLLLAFRTKISYARWNEARTAWGKVINDSRSIARMGCIWSKSYKNIDDADIQRLGEAICSFSRSLMNRTLPPQEDEQRFLSYTHCMMTDQGYANILRNAKHRPTAALAEITTVLIDLQLNPMHQVELELAVTGLCDALGASERIFTSPAPIFYTRHTARLLAFWLIFLPLGLYEPFAASWNHWLVVPVTLILSGFLLGIEELATQMEEPFSILPMEKMCEGSIRASVMEQVERSKAGMQSRYYGEGGTASMGQKSILQP